MERRQARAMEVKTKITMSRRSGRGSRRITCQMTILIDSILRAGDTANERVGHQDRQPLKIRSSDSNLRGEENCRQNMTHEQVSRCLYASGGGYLRPLRSLYLASASPISSRSA